MSTTQYAPQGFLINGKIVPSVAANDLTVAIKGMDGNNPSASNPVYCRIGDTVRTITAALSVTKNDGTNWFNSGSAELATKEVDYFVYLGYNATDGVVIGFARIPYANRYDGFSATSTNERYCAISTITNAAAGDYYEVIGRFAATLSAGAGYTWTVPTFTALNLIQRPIYNTRYLTYAPTTTGGTSITGDPGRYMLRDNQCSLSIPNIDGTSNATTKTVTLPISTGASFSAIYNSGMCNVKDNGAHQASPGQIQLVASDSIADIHKSWYQTVWTGSGAFSIFITNLQYEI
jgi:hypothetical protein